MDLEKLRLGVSPLTKSVYLYRGKGVRKSSENIDGYKRDFEQEVMGAVTDRILLEKDLSVNYSFGDQKFRLTLERV